MYKLNTILKCLPKNHLFQIINFKNFLYFVGLFYIISNICIAFCDVETVRIGSQDVPKETVEEIIKVFRLYRDFWHAYGSYLRKARALGALNNPELISTLDEHTQQVALSDIRWTTKLAQLLNDNNIEVEDFIEYVCKVYEK